MVSGRYLRSAIQGLDRLSEAVIRRVTCKGKLIVFHLLGKDNEPFAVLSTLGMTGWWFVDIDINLDAGEHKRIELTFVDGSTAAFFDPRNFGTFKVVSYAEMKRKIAELGPDVLSDPRLLASYTFTEFIERVKRFGKNQTISEGLLDQRLAAGCGNYIRADSMYLGRFSPHRFIATLSDQELQQLWRSISQIARSSFLNLHPITLAPGFKNLCYGQTVGVSGNKIETFVDKSSRTVWWCPEEQTY